MGSTRVTSPTSKLPPSRASSEGLTVIDFTSTIVAFLEPGILKNLTLDTCAVGTGSSDSDIGPSITRSRPVACLAMATIRGLYVLRSKNDGAIRSATMSSANTPPAPINSFLRLEEIIAFALDRLGKH